MPPKAKTEPEEDATEPKDSRDLPPSHRDPATTDNWLHAVVVRGDMRRLKPGVRIVVVREDGPGGPENVGEFLSNLLPNAAGVIYRRWKAGKYTLIERKAGGAHGRRVTLTVSADYFNRDDEDGGGGYAGAFGAAPAAPALDLYVSMGKLLEAQAGATAKLFESLNRPQADPLEAAERIIRLGVSIARGEAPEKERDGEGSNLFDVLRDAVDATVDLLGKLVTKGKPTPAPSSAPALAPAESEEDRPRRKGGWRERLVLDGLEKLLAKGIEFYRSNADALETAKLARSFAPDFVLASLERASAEEVLALLAQSKDDAVRALAAEPPFREWVARFLEGMRG